MADKKKGGAKAAPEAAPKAAATSTPKTHADKPAAAAAASASAKPAAKSTGTFILLFSSSLLELRQSLEPQFSDNFLLPLHSLDDFRKAQAR